VRLGTRPHACSLQPLARSAGSSPAHPPLRVPRCTCSPSSTSPAATLPLQPTCHSSVRTLTSAHRSLSKRHAAARVAAKAAAAHAARPKARPKARPALHERRRLLLALALVLRRHAGDDLVAHGRVEVHEVVAHILQVVAARVVRLAHCSSGPRQEKRSGPRSRAARARNVEQTHRSSSRA
jgi:hypothetical protein